MFHAFKSKEVRRWGVIAIMIVALLFVGQIFLSGKANGMAMKTEAKVVSVVAAKTVEANGSLQAGPFAALTWNTGGVVEEVNVEAGDQVRAGDVLMKLRKNSVSPGILSAQADLVNAQKDLDKLLASSSADQAQAAIDLRDARQAYDRAVNYLGFLERSKTTSQTQAKTFIESINRGGKKYVFKTKEFKGPAPEDWMIEAENDLALKKAQLEDAQRAYDRLADGPNARDVTIAQVKIDAAQAKVDSFSILAPFDGEVLYIESQPNGVVTADSVALHMANLDHLYIEAQVSESDVASIKVGNPVTATLEAVPGLELTGHVAAIDPLGEVDSNSVQYTVRIDLDRIAEDVSLPLGSTANVMIRVKEAAPSLAVPITVIQNDSRGEYVLVVQGDGSTKRVEVVTGMIVRDQVTVAGDLQEGDILTTSPGNVSMPGIGSGLGKLLR